MHKLEFSKAVYLKTDNDRRKIDTTLSTTREFRESCSLDKSWNWFLKPDNSQMNQG